MDIRNAGYREVRIRWDGITLPLRAGTPISQFGAVANDGRAVGIVPQAIRERPVTDSVFLLVGGDVDLAEVEREYGSALTEDARAAMSGIRFYGPDGTPVPDYVRTQYTLPAASAAALGGVKLAEAVTPADTGEDATAAGCAEAINALIAALQASGAMAAPEDD